MEILSQRPPNFADIVKVFPMASMPGVLFAYAPNIYYPSGGDLTPALVEHEKVHIKRQLEIGVDLWWSRYLTDPEFRYYEELLAHRAEYQDLLLNASSRQLRRQALGIVAKRLASPLYGRIRSLEQTKRDLQAVEVKELIKG